MSTPSPTIYPGYTWVTWDPEDTISPPGWTVTTAGDTVVDVGDHAEMIPYYGDQVNDVLARVRKADIVSVAWIDLERMEPHYVDGAERSFVSFTIPRDFTGLFYRGFAIGWQISISDDPQWGDEMWLLSTDDFTDPHISLGSAYGRKELMYTRVFVAEQWVDRIYVDGVQVAEGPWAVGSGETYGGWVMGGLDCTCSAYHPTDDDNTTPHHVADLYGLAYGTSDPEDEPVFEEEPVLVGGWSAVWGTSG